MDCLKKYLQDERPIKNILNDDNIAEHITGHWIFTSKFTPEEVEIIKKFNPDSIALMTLDQKVILYKSKLLKEFGDDYKINHDLINKLIFNSPING